MNNSTPVAERKHIAFFGCRNAGKSSLINAVTNQKLAIVSEIKGTTTDPVYKTMELLPAGPVVFIDTPGIDDEGELGNERIKKAYEVLNKTDCAVLVIDSKTGRTTFDHKLHKLIEEKKIPYCIAYNKCDDNLPLPDVNDENSICVSASTGFNINLLKEKIASLLIKNEIQKPLVSDLLQKGSIVVLVIPIDKAAPKGRLILPQQQVIRELLDSGSIPVLCQVEELQNTLEKLSGNVSLVITDSQAFSAVSKIVPDEMPLTSFSILFSRYKGELEFQLNAVSAIDSLNDGDTVLIAEGCTHHRQCGDIGTEKIPNMLKKTTGKQISFEFTSGTEFPDNLKKYKLIIHCGGCMLNEREMKYRIEHSAQQNIPVTNYGMALAKMTGVLERSTRIFRK